MWDEPPGNARNTVQAHVAGLRRVLGAASLSYRAPGYVLTLATPCTDAAEAQGPADLNEIGVWEAFARLALLE